MEQMSLDVQREDTWLSERIELDDDDAVIAAAESFATSLPHTREPFSKRNWGGVGHSLCSYQGKLKPAIGYFLVDTFTRPGESVLDPMSGVGTIPFEARRLGRVGIGTDLSPVAVSVTAAKLGHLSSDGIEAARQQLQVAIRSANDSVLDSTDVTWGLNGEIESYFDRQTLIELVAARDHFLAKRQVGMSNEDHFVFAALLHILHGNRPYALSRTSHPITPLKPRGDFVYRPVLEALDVRLSRVLPYFFKLQEEVPDGCSELAALEDLRLPSKVDAVITSPPFISSLRFWSANWMRMWFAGWERADFAERPKQFLETKQKASMNAYEAFSDSSARNLREGGLLVMHLGVTAQRDMGDEIAPYLAKHFRVLTEVRENVSKTESHGLTDKGRTIHHAYLFARRTSA